MIRTRYWRWQWIALIDDVDDVNDDDVDVDDVDVHDDVDNAR